MSSIFLPMAACTLATCLVILLRGLLTLVLECRPIYDIICIVTMSSWFAPTNLVITFEIKGQGRFAQEELEKLVERDSKGIVYLNLPTKSVLVTNHQVSPPPPLCSVFRHTDEDENCRCMRIGGESSPFLDAFSVFRPMNFHRYAWCLTYFMNTHRDVYIVLKKSLKWVPVVGWVCGKSSYFPNLVVQ